MKTLKFLSTALIFAFSVLAFAQSPPSPGSTMLGCFRDQGDPNGTGGRDLNGHAFNGPNMTGAVCRAECARRGFAYAGTQYSTWCFCGNQYGKSGEASNCNMPCAGNAQEICGGAWANSVSRTGATAGPAPSGSINVQGATYGANCGAPANNVTGHAKKTCDGRGTCDYRVDHQVIGDPAYGCQKNYTVTWTCGPGTPVRSASAPPEAGFGSVVQLSCAGQPPTVVTPITPPVTPPVTPLPPGINLTGRWSANDGGTYYLRQIGSDLWWYGRSSDGGVTWSNVLFGSVQGNRVVGRWADVPQGRIMSGGEMEITIASPDRLTATRRTGGFGGSEWTRQR